MRYLKLRIQVSWYVSWSFLYFDSPLICRCRLNILRFCGLYFLRGDQGYFEPGCVLLWHGCIFLVYSFGVVRGHTFSCVIVAPLVLKRSGFCSGPMVFPSYVLGWGRVVTILGWF